MSGGLRVALLAHGDPGGVASDVAAALRDEGLDATLLRPRGLPEAPLRLRGFTGPLTQIPGAVAGLARGGFDVVHAFSAPDAHAGLLWRRLGGGPVVFGCAEVLDRGALADRRLRLRLLTAAIEDTDAVVAPTREAQEALRRWMATDAPLIDPCDGAGHARLYRRLLDQT